jgi:MinD superfamily P-loop ATPase
VEKYQISVVPENCTGCLRCQLACSEFYSGRFTLQEARLEIILSGSVCAIRFSEDCTSCGVCADNCLYDALLKTPGEASP